MRYLSTAFTVVCALAFLVTAAWGQVDGDFRTSTSGNWNNVATWETYSGGIWSAATSTPGASNNVYIQKGHTVTLVQDEACNDLNVCTRGGGIRISTSYTLSVNGKFRAYGAEVGTIPGADTTGISSIFTTTSPGKIKLVGTTRTVTSSTSWAANPQYWTFEIAMNSSSDTAKFGTNIKAGTITISSGVAEFLSRNTMRADSGSAGTGNITVNSGATLKLDGNAAITRTATASTGYLNSLTINGTLIFGGPTNSINANNINFSGTVIYDSIGVQTLTVKTPSGGGSANPDTYTNLTLKGVGAKTLGLNTTVNGTLSMQGTATLSLGTFTLAYGGSATLEYKGDATQTTGAELPTTMPGSIIINNLNGVNLSASTIVNGTLVLTNGTFAVGSNTLTLNGPSISGTLTNLSTTSSSSLVFGGSSAGVTIPSNVTTLYNLGINNTNGVTLSGNLTVTDSLYLLNGKLLTGTNVITVMATITGPGTGKFVEGNLSLPVSTTGTKTWYLGLGSDYLPVTANLSSLTGSDNITATILDRTSSTPAGPIGSGNKILKKYTRFVKGSGITSFDALVTFAYSNSDVSNQGISDKTGIRVFQWDGSSWDEATFNSRDTANNSITISASNVTSLSDVVLSTGMQAIFSVSAPTLAFGSIASGSSKVDSVMVTNNGSSTLTISAVDLTDTSFSVAPTSSTIAPLSSQKFTITFHPTSAGVRTANVIFTHDGLTTVDTVHVTGAGAEGTISFSSKTVSFANVTVGSQKTDSLTVTNSGTGTLVISSVASSNSRFSVLPTSGSLTESASMKFYITFSPSDTGNSTGKIFFIHTGLTSPDTVLVSGNGIEAISSLNKHTIDFGSVDIGVMKKDTVTVTNRGNSTLQIDSVKSTDASFSVAPTSCALTPLSSQKFVITFQPGSVGAKTGKVIFAHNGITSADTVQMSGTGARGAITFSSKTMNFGNVTVGKQKTDSLTITNSGNGTLIISIITSTNNKFSYTLSASDTLAPSAMEKVYIKFSPSDTGTVTGKIIFVHTGLTSPDTVLVSGNGVEAISSLDKHSIDFGAIAVGTSKKDTVTVANQGNTALQISSVTSTSSVFSVTPTSVSINPGQQQKFAITASLDSAKQRSGYIIFTHNGTTSPDSVKVTVNSLTDVASQNGIVYTYKLMQNYPNPFNPSTSIQYSVASQSRVTIKVYTLLGQEIAKLEDGIREAGYHQIVWQGRLENGLQAASGVYLYRLQAQPTNNSRPLFIEIKKMVLIR